MKKTKLVLLGLLLTALGGCGKDAPVDMEANHPSLVGSWSLEETIKEEHYFSYKSIFLRITKNGHAEYLECVNHRDTSSTIKKTSHKSVSFPDARVIAVNDTKLTLEQEVLIFNIEYNLSLSAKHMNDTEYLIVEGHQLSKGQLSGEWYCPESE